MFKDPSRYGKKDCYAFIAFGALCVVLPLALSIAGVNLWEGFAAWGILIGTIMIALTLYWLAE